MPVLYMYSQSVYDMYDIVLSNTQCHPMLIACMHNTCQSNDFQIDALI